MADGGNLNWLAGFLDADDAAGLAGDGGDAGDAPVYTNSRDAILVVLDCNPTMFVAPPAKPRRAPANGGDESDTDDEGNDQDEDEDDEDEDDGVDPLAPSDPPAAKTLRKLPFYAAVQCVRTLLMDRAIDGTGDLVGVLMYNTRKADEPTARPGIHLYRSMQEPDANVIRDLWEMGSSEAKFDKDIGSTVPGFPPASLTSVVQQALAAFQSIKGKVGHKRLIWITNHDRPPGCDDLGTSKALHTRFRDARNMSIDLACYFFPTATTGAFDLAPFWGACLGYDEDHDYTSLDPSTDTDGVAPSLTVPLFVTSPSALRSAMRRREARQRTGFRAVFRLTPNSTMGVRGYVMYIKAPKQAAAPARVLAETYAPVTRVSQFICEETTGVIDPGTQIELGTCYAGQNVYMSLEERAAIIGGLGNSGEIVLLGFKRRKTLKRTHNLTHSTFLYPDEAAYRGSIAVFAALVDQLILQDKYAVARYHPRAGSAPRLAALIPQRETRDPVTNDVVVPGGLHAIPLPFKDDLRRVEWPVPPNVPNGEEVDPEIDYVGAARRPGMAAAIAAVAGKWRAAAFDPSAFQRTDTLQFARVMHAKALDRPVVEPPPDVDESGLTPDYARWQARVANAAKVFLAAAGPLSRAGTTKAAAAPAVKRKRGPDEMDTEVLAAAREWLLENGSLNQWTIQQLKEVLRELGLPLSGRKAELVDRVETALREAQAVAGSSA
ncbi:X-ray repair cross-complementing protein 6 [Allomyces javanicus]|nr:X-ray repair cross-complementing protein 6 [Allomyces javanicus]